MPFPHVYRMEESIAIWRSVDAPVLWVAATDSEIPLWLERHAGGDVGSDGLAGVRRRLAHVRNGRLVTISDAGHMLHHDQPAAVARADRTVPRRLSMSMLRVHSRRAAYVSLALLTLVWGFNWIVHEGGAAARASADLQRAAHVARRGGAVRRAARAARSHFGRHQLASPSWSPAFFQTTINFGATTMAVAGGGAGRASVLVFTMPFWTLLIAWPVLHERVRRAQLVAIACWPLRGSC